MRFAKYLKGLVMAAVLLGAVAIAVPQAATGFYNGIAFIKTGHLVWSDTAPTVSSGFGTSPSINSSNGATTFRVDVGTGGSATSGVLAMPTATAGWNCIVADPTANKSTKQTAGGTTSVTVTGYEGSGTTATAWTASTLLKFHCAAY